MDPMAGDGQQPGARERSTGKLVSLAAEQVSVLVRSELKLAQLEMTRKGKQAGAGTGLLGGGGLVALYGVGCLIACAVIALSAAVAAWLAALIVGAAFWPWPPRRPWRAGTACARRRLRCRGRRSAASRLTWPRSRKGPGDDARKRAG